MADYAREENRMFHKTFLINRRAFYRFILAGTLVLILVLTVTHSHATAKVVQQKSFTSPEAAVKALYKAIKSQNNKVLMGILGPGSKEIIYSGDAVSDRVKRTKFIRAYKDKHSIEKQSDDKMILHVGNSGWPLPIPIVKKGKAWYFDAKAGQEEILNRRIGRNELNVLDIMHAYLDAQREYAGKDRNENGVLEFAQRLISTKGKHNGLYWEAKEGEEMSPFGPLVARAAMEGYTEEGTVPGPHPFHGYYFRILKAQGGHAVGGAYDYVAKGKMILGFGLIAYPAQYGNSGVMTFIVNQEGVVYQKDLGRKTAELVETIKVYDPDETWKKAEEGLTP